MKKLTYVVLLLLIQTGCGTAPQTVSSAVQAQLTVGPATCNFQASQFYNEINGNVANLSTEAAVLDSLKTTHNDVPDSSAQDSNDATVFYDTFKVSGRAGLCVTFTVKFKNNLYQSYTADFTYTGYQWTSIPN